MFALSLNRETLHLIVSFPHIEAQTQLARNSGWYYIHFAHITWQSQFSLDPNLLALFQLAFQTAVEASPTPRCQQTKRLELYLSRNWCLH